MSGDLAGNLWARLPRPVHRFGNCWFSAFRATIALWVGHPSCWYNITWRKFSGRSSISTGKIRLKNRLYFRPLSLPSIKYGPTMWCPTIPHHTLTLHWLWCFTWRSQCGFSTAQKCMLCTFTFPWFVKMVSSVNNILLVKSCPWFRTHWLYSRWIWKYL